MTAHALQGSIIDKKVCIERGKMKVLVWLSKK